MRQAHVWYRVGLGLLTLVALTVQFVYSRRDHGGSAVNFFSYFTNLSNILCAVIFVYTGMRKYASMTVDLLRGAATTYLALTGIVYHLLLTGVDTLGVVLPWVNLVIHSVMPLAAVVDWVARPPKHVVGWRRTWTWLIFPAVYLIYSLIRGAAVGWYPYPFLDLEEVGGAASVAAYCAAIAVGLAGLVWAVMWIGNRQRRQMRPGT